MQRLGDSPAFSLRRWLRPSHRAEHAGEPGWPSTAAGRATGLYHSAIVYPTRAALAAALRSVLAARIPLEGAADHRDPDENGVELYCDRPRELWPRDSSGELAGCTRRLICKACSANLKPMSPCRLGHPIYSQVLVVKAEGRSRWSPLLPRLIPNFFLRLATFT
jgi:catechol 2,3-dioxygenase